MILFSAQEERKVANFITSRNWKLNEMKPKSTSDVSIKQ